MFCLSIEHMPLFEIPSAVWTKYTCTVCAVWNISSYLRFNKNTNVKVSKKGLYNCKKTYEYLLIFFEENMGEIPQ